MFHQFGGLAAVRWRNRDGFRILMYHRFWPPSEQVTRSLEAELHHIRENYTVRALPDIVEDIRAAKPLDAHTLSITVDDGHRDFYTVAYPVLKAHSIPATVFLTSGFLDGFDWLWFDRVVYAFQKTNNQDFEADVPGLSLVRLPLATPEERLEAATIVAEALQPLPVEERVAWTKQLPERLAVQIPHELPEEYAPLMWDEVREMSRNGISFGAHTVNHPTLFSLKDDATLHYELAESKRRVEDETQQASSIFCYPNGRDEDVGSRVIEAVKACGFKGAVMTEPGLNTPSSDLFRLRRMGVEPVAEPLYFAQQCAVLRR